MRETVKWLASEEMVLYYIRNFRDSMWPNGKLAPSRPIRSEEVKSDGSISALYVKSNSLGKSGYARSGKGENHEEHTSSSAKFRGSEKQQARRIEGKETADKSSILFVLNHFTRFSKPFKIEEPTNISST